MLYRKIRGKCVFVERVGSFDFQITIAGKSVIVQLSKPETFFNLVEDAMLAENPQMEFNFNNDGECCF